MGRSLETVLKSLPTDRQQKIQTRYEELYEEVTSLKELRVLSEKSQAEIAVQLHTSQPAVSKIEHQTDMYLSTLQKYVEALGGELYLFVRLPGHQQPIKVRSLEDVSGA
jgi:transcriptional regulator with XRE-family HTH domain